ncbi:MAG: type IV pilin N-terminal domain-containing protein [Methanolobus sp.]|nr:type IV pilin N-terminal domain-containing protein [Methanolobus sp.]
MKKQILNFRWHTGAVSPVIGVIMLLFLTILLAGITVSSVYSGDAVLSLSQAPMALIEVEYVEGGVRNYPAYVRYEENFIYLEHIGGDPLQADSTRIIISGEGSSYEGVVPHGTRHYGEVSIIYDSLLFEGKKSAYASRNPDISDGVWSAGEELILNGDDAINGSIFSTVSVGINDVANTANHYGLKEDSMVTIKVFDKESQCIISEFEYVVTPAD